MLTVHTVKAFQDNYIWLIQAENSRKVLIVDPGDAGPVFAALEQKHLMPAAILITHHHADHVGGVTALVAEYDLPVFGPAAEQIPCISQPLRAVPALEVDPDFPAFEVLDTPGHTGGHICYRVENKLFCGDTLFAGGCGRLLGGNAAQLFSSLQRLKTLAPETQVFCAHEYTEANLRFAAAVEKDNPALQQRIQQVAQCRQQGLGTIPSLMAEELATNPFLRTQLPNVRKAAETYIGRPLADEQAVFSSLRQWKDNF